MTQFYAGKHGNRKATVQHDKNKQSGEYPTPLEAIEKACEMTDSQEAHLYLQAWQYGDELSDFDRV